MIGDPLNDTDCLELVTQRTESSVESESIKDLAKRFTTTRNLARWIRELPQKNDDGTAADGPRVNCDVPQRLRLPTDDPNCVERSALYLAASERIDPAPLRQLATIATPLGRHTFPVENERPVNLDPALPRNALDAGLFRILAVEDGYEPAVRDARDAFEWVLALAEDQAEHVRGSELRLRNAERALSALHLGSPLPRNSAEDLGFALALAEAEAELYGESALEVVEMSDRALRSLLRRNAPRNRLALRVGGSTIKPNWGVLGALGNVGGKLAMDVGAAYVKSQLGWLGLAPDVIKALEKEMNSEGLSLGEIAKPPPEKGTLAALTTSALLKRRMHQS